MNCKLGDIAILVKTKYAGHIVEVVGTFFDFDEFGDFAEWRIRFQRPTRASDGALHIDYVCPDAWLRPISGIPDEETIDEPIAETA